MGTSVRQSERESGIELLKIIAMLLIVLNHLIQSLTEVNLNMPFSDYVLDINSSTTNLANLLLAVLRISGCLGNDLFVVCSAWFFLNSKGSSKKKVVFLIIDIWAVSVLIFAVTYLCGCDLDRDETLKQFFPTANANNWFLTCYILFYLIHPFLNKIIYELKKQTMLITTLTLVLLYSLLNFFRPWFFNGNLFYMTDLIVWIMIYFVVAYMKLYAADAAASPMINVISLIIGLAGQALCTCAINLMGLKWDMFNGKLLYFNYGGSPFVILTALAALNLVRHMHFKNRFINYISGLSLLIYLIHENVIIAFQYRPYIFIYIYQHFGYSHILLWLFAVLIAYFIVSVIAAFIYRQTVERLVRPVSDKVYVWLKALYEKIEKGLMKIH